jgi:hypothetical protein
MVKFLSVPSYDLTYLNMLGRNFAFYKTKETPVGYLFIPLI